MIGANTVSGGNPSGGSASIATQGVDITGSEVSLFGVKIPPKIVKFVEKISNFIKEVFLIIATCVTFIIAPHACALGFFAGILFEKQTSETFEKIHMIWQKQAWQFILIGSVALFLCLPVTFLAASSLLGARLGHRMAQGSKEPVVSPPLPSNSALDREVAALGGVREGEPPVPVLEQQLPQEPDQPQGEESTTE